MTTKIEKEVYIMEIAEKTSRYMDAGNAMRLKLATNSHGATYMGHYRPDDIDIGPIEVTEEERKDLRRAYRFNRTIKVTLEIPDEPDSENNI